MGNKRIFLFILGFSIFIAAENSADTADDVLLKVINRLAGIDRSMVISSEIYKNEKLIEEQKLKLFIHWPINSDVKKMTHIEYEKPKKKRGVRFWEHLLISEEKPKCWITLPVTGKLKDITDKKQKQRGFALSELQLTMSDVINHENSIIGEDNINGRDVYLVESVEKKSNKKITKKILMIDKEDHFIWGVDTKNKHGKLVKSINCNKLSYIDGIPVLTVVEVWSKKGKKKIKVKLDNIEFHPKLDLQIFNPKGNA